MTKKRNPYKTYTKEFKLEALRLMETSDRPASEVAMQLHNPGINGVRLTAVPVNYNKKA